MKEISKGHKQFFGIFHLQIKHLQNIRQRIASVVMVIQVAVLNGRAHWIYWASNSSNFMKSSFFISCMRMIFTAYWQISKQLICPARKS